MKQRHPIWKWAAWFAAALLILVLLIAAAFVLNGLVLAARNQPVVGGVPSHSPEPAEHPTLRLMSWNLAKLNAYHGRGNFDSAAVIQERVTEIAKVIRDEDPDVLFLSEAMFHLGPTRVNQIAELAEAAGLPHWLFGENYNIGVPGLRVSGGNAILSKYPLTAVTNLDLPGRKPFWVSKNNRRALFGEVALPGGGTLMLVALHNDSYSEANGLKQLEHVQAFLDGRPALIGGDFNIRGTNEAFQAWVESAGLTGSLFGELTFPAEAPTREIDFILAPRNWTINAHHVGKECVSDHRAVISEMTPPATR